MSYVFLLIAIVSEVIATSFLKAANGFTVLWPSLGAIVGYGAAFYFLSLSLSDIPVGVAYAIWAGLGIVLISLTAAVIYQQRLDWGAIAGIVLIIGGVMVIKLFSKVS